MVTRGAPSRSLAADAGPALGLAPSFWIFDEFGASPDRRLFDALRTGTGKRVNSVRVIISTQAETDQHPFSQMIDACIAGRAPGTALQLIAAPTDADAFDPETLKAANPAWGEYLNPTNLLNEMEEAKRSAAAEPGYRRFRLNQRVQSDAGARLLDAETWKAGAHPIDEAIDDAEKHDLAALAMVFIVEGIHYVLLRVWTPLGQLDRRRPAERELFRQWLKEGWLIGVPGPIITTDFVIGEIAKLHKTFSITEFRHDTARLEEYRFALSKAGLTIPLEKHRQGPFSIAESASYFTEVAYAGKLVHGNHPLLNYAIANAVTVADCAGNVSIHKGKSHSTSKLRIDPLIAAIMAIRPPNNKPRDFTMMFI
jgi:phage terminase large subunit-like protein